MHLPQPQLRHHRCLGWDHHHHHDHHDDVDKDNDDSDGEDDDDYDCGPFSQLKKKTPQIFGRYQFAGTEGGRPYYQVFSGNQDFQF